MQAGRGGSGGSGFVMTDQKPNCYVITEEQMKEIRDMIFHEDEIKFEKLSWKIVSHPAPSPLVNKRVPYIECNHSYSSCPINWDAHDAAIRNAERNATLERILEWVDNADNNFKDPGNGKHYVCLPDLVIFTGSLRTKEQP
jgi:acetone carboxylase gamma subunit